MSAAILKALKILARITKAAQHILNSQSEEKGGLMIGIFSLVGLLFITILMAFYLLTLPFSWLSGMFLGDELGHVNALRENYSYAALDPDYYDYTEGFDTYGGVFTLPLAEFNITSPYGSRSDPFGNGEVHKHTGIDLQPAHHAEIMAVYDGTIVKASPSGGDAFGNCVEIEHELNGVIIYTFYAHMSQVDVTVGQFVEQGEVIGLEGGEPGVDPNPGSSTGHHLHFEVRKKRGYLNDIDPYPYLFGQ